MTASAPPQGPAPAPAPPTQADALRRRLAEQPADAEAGMALARLCWHQGDPYEAELRVREITRHHAGHADAWHDFGTLNRGRPAVPDIVLPQRTAFAAAVALHRAGRLDEAAAAYRSILAGEADHSAAWNLEVLAAERARPPAETAAISIYVCCHKPAPVLADALHRPIHVGRARAGQAVATLGDDSGDNISAKNGSYCELTGHYWAWRNDRTSEHVGLAHYRRLFLFAPVEDATVDRTRRRAIPLALPPDGCVRTGLARSLIQSADVVLPMPWALQEPLETQFLRSAPPGRSADYEMLWQLMMEAVRRHHPAVHAAGVPALETGVGYFYNMLVMRRPLFDAYSGFLFDVLGRVEACAAALGITIFAERLAGFMGERLLTMYVAHLRVQGAARIREVPVAHLV
jgi:hypothetical protein